MIPEIILKQTFIFSFAENADGKYVSPFHDIPMYADEEQVKWTIPSLFVFTSPPYS